MPNFNDTAVAAFYRFDDPRIVEDVEFTNEILVKQKWQQQYGSDSKIKYVVNYHLKTDILRFLLPRFQHKNEYVIDEHGIIVGYWEGDTLFHYGRISKEIEIQVLTSSKRIERQTLGKFQNWVF